MIKDEYEFYNCEPLSLSGLAPTSHIIEAIIFGDHLSSLWSFTFIGNKCVFKLYIFESERRANPMELI